MFADPKTAVEGAYAAWDVAFNKGDLKSIAAAYLPGAKLLPPNHEIALGPSAIENFYAGALANGITDHRLELIDAGGDDKIIYSTARWSAKGKDKDGQPAIFSGLATYVFERQANNADLELGVWSQALRRVNSQTAPFGARVGRLGGGVGEAALSLSIRHEPDPGKAEDHHRPAFDFAFIPRKGRAACEREA